MATKKSSREPTPEEEINNIMHLRSVKVYDPNKVERAHVVGVGGIGTWVAIDLAMAGVKELHLYDADTLAAHNLNRLPFTLDDVGSLKTEVLAKFISNVRPSCKVVQHKKFIGQELTPEDLKSAKAVYNAAKEIDLKDNDAVIVCVDTGLDNNRVDAIIKAKGVQLSACVRGAYNEDRVTIMTGGYQWDEGPGGYGGVPSYIAPPQVVAALIMEKIYRSPDLEVNAVPLSYLGLDDETRQKKEVEAAQRAKEVAAAAQVQAQPQH